MNIDSKPLEFLELVAMIEGEFPTARWHVGLCGCGEGKYAALIRSSDFASGPALTARGFEFVTVGWAVEGHGDSLESALGQAYGKAIAEGKSE